jgi:hypothetical protein
MCTVDEVHAIERVLEVVAAARYPAEGYACWHVEKHLPMP